MNKELIEKYYKMGLFTLNDLLLFVKGGYLTEKEKESILKSIDNEVKQ